MIMSPYYEELNVLDFYHRLKNDIYKSNVMICEINDLSYEYCFDDQNCLVYKIDSEGDIKGYLHKYSREETLKLFNPYLRKSKINKILKIN